MDACESFCSLPSDVCRTSVQEAKSGVDVDLTEFDEPWPEQQQINSCGKCNNIKYQLPPVSDPLFFDLPLGIKNYILRFILLSARQ